MAGGQFSHYCFFLKKMMPRFLVTNVDQGFSANKKFQPKKLTNQKTAGTKSLSPHTHSTHSLTRSLAHSLTHFPTHVLLPCFLFCSQVTPNAWKWPPLWPYTPDYFDRPDESEDEKAFERARMSPCLEGSAKDSLVKHYSRFLTAGTEILEIGQPYNVVVDVSVFHSLCLPLSSSLSFSCLLVYPCFSPLLLYLCASLSLPMSLWYRYTYVSHLSYCLLLV